MAEDHRVPYTYEVYFITKEKCIATARYINKLHPPVMINGYWSRWAVCYAKGEVLYED